MFSGVRPRREKLVYCSLLLNLIMYACGLALRKHSYFVNHFSKNLVSRRLSKFPQRRLLSSKPDFISELNNKHFEFQSLEKRVYDWWFKSDLFKPVDDPTKRPFVIPMPPPNVTGYLHMGHAMFLALQDLIARYHRMQGRPTLWLPGTDHAGIATQLLVERALSKDGIHRKTLGRDEFVKKVWEWKDDKGNYITEQMKRLGASADWSRERFTLEKEMNESVTEAFVRLYERGLIYKGEYLVNWSPNLQTAVSDLEVDYVEELGKLYFFKYELEDNSGFITVATTRPETILGDVAVCVHPEDARYAHLHGKYVLVPFVQPTRKIPIIADPFVDSSFGTGAVKITPAHDYADYEVGKRHSLPCITIMNKDATINSVGGPRYQGMDRFTCRDRIWHDLEKADLAIKADPYMQRIPRSQRGGDIIEPLLSKQWFMKMEGMARKAVQAAKSKELSFIPERYEKIWYGWLENIHDWCISRQLWWGHRIPVYYLKRQADNTTSELDFVVARSIEEAETIARNRYPDQLFTLVQDEDVLDTWFSSGLWPFSSVGWPRSESEVSSDFSKFYPASVMETGYDILLFWVARMVMMGIELTGKVPFHTVYLHGLVRDAHGQKMSKTSGNVIDPIDTVNKYGCDALRFSLILGSVPGQDIPLSLEKIESARNFVNKLWNIGKFVNYSLTNQPGSVKTHSNLEDLAAAMPTFPLAERFIISRLHQLTADVTEAIEVFNFNKASLRLYEFIWDDFADWYIEASKTRMRDPTSADIAKRVLVYVWDVVLRLLHPFMPFVSETLWQCIQSESCDSIMTAPWPRVNDAVIDQKSTKSFESLQGLVRAVRNVRAEYKVEGRKKIAAVVVSPDAELLTHLSGERDAIAMLGRIDDTSIQFTDPNAVASLHTNRLYIRVVVHDGLDAFLLLSSMVDHEKELQRLRKQEKKLQAEIDSLEATLSRAGFVEQAPPALVADVRAKVYDRKEQLASVLQSINTLDTTIQ